MAGEFTNGSGAQEARAVADAAAEAFTSWSRTGPNARRALLLKAAVEMETRADAFVAAVAEETGAAEGWARFNVQLATGMVREAASLTTQIGGEVIPSDKPGCIAMALKEPAGVVLGIAPWNAPVILAVRAVAVPLACGNSVILKGSEVCPSTHSLVVEAFAAAGFPPGVVNLVLNAPDDAGEVVGALIDHPSVRRISFTGSTAIGRIVARRAADNLKPVLLELGGKAPLIVLEDADLQEAVNAAAFGAFLHQGQICMSTERIIVVEAVADRFAELMAAKAGALPPLGAVIGSGTVERVNAMIEDAQAKGARLLAGGRSHGVAMRASVLDDVAAGMDVYSKESFGPVVGIVRAKDEEEAIRLANDSEYGLSAAIFTRDVARGLRLARRVRSGICHINGPTVHDEPQMPFGGVGASGYGRFGGKAGVDFFTELRWITIESEPGRYTF
jgi:acyl-CoA reductase-like NAD-dependent aldehyde dehydrogenase